MVATKKNQASAKSEDEQRFDKTTELIHDIQKSHLSATKLFKQWDDNNDGKVTKAEFRRAVPMLVGVIDPKPTKADADRLFEAWDSDKGGSLLAA